MRSKCSSSSCCCSSSRLLEQQQMELQEVRAQLAQMGKSPPPSEPAQLEPMRVDIGTRPDSPAVATTHAVTPTIELQSLPLALGSTRIGASPTLATMPTELVVRPMSSPLGSLQAPTVESIELPGSPSSSQALPPNPKVAAGGVAALAAVGLTPPSTELLNTPALGGMQQQQQQQEHAAAARAAAEPQLQQEPEQQGQQSLGDSGGSVSEGGASSSHGFVVVQQAKAAFPWPAHYSSPCTEENPSA